MKQEDRKDLLNENEFEKAMRIDELEEETSKLKKQIIPLSFGLGILLGAVIIGSFSAKTTTPVAPVNVIINNSCSQAEIQKKLFDSKGKGAGYILEMLIQEDTATTTTTATRMKTIDENIKEGNPQPIEIKELVSKNLFL